MQEMYVVLIFSSYTQLLSTVIVYTMTISLSGLVMVYYQPHAIVHKYDLYKLWTANYINFVIFWQITWAEFKVKQSMMKLWDLAWMKSNTFNEASLHLATTFGFCDYLWLGAFFWNNLTANIIVIMGSIFTQWKPAVLSFTEMALGSQDKFRCII